VTGEGLLVNDDSGDNFICSIDEYGNLICCSKRTSGKALTACFAMRGGLVRTGALRSEVYLSGRGASELLYVEAAGCSAFPSTQNGILAAFFGGEAPPPGAGTLLVLILGFACWEPPVLPAVANKGRMVGG
jgi:hypothetical protein